MTNAPKLPEFLKNITILGTMEEELESCRAQVNTNGDVQFEVNPYALPIENMPKELRKAYDDNNMDAVKDIERKTREKMEVISENIKQNGMNAWVKAIDSDGVQFLIVYTPDACMWVYPRPDLTPDNEEKKQLVIMIGSFCNSTGQATNAATLVTSSEFITDAISFALASVIAKALSSIISFAVDWTTMAVALLLTNAARNLGFTSLTFFVPTFVTGTVACILTAGVFVALYFLFKMITYYVVRDFYISLRIFNFDETGDWRSSEDIYLDNAVISGDKDEQKYTSFVIPRKQKVEFPPFIHAKSDDIIVSYAEINLQNDNNIMEGLGTALSMSKTDSADGFTLAVDCPFLTNTKIKAASPLNNDLKEFFDRDNWTDDDCLTIDVNGVPAVLHLHDKSHANDDIYVVDVFIGKDKIE